MDGFSAFICGAQAVGYAFSVVKGLNELQNALKYGRCFLDDAQISVGHLQEIIIQLIPHDGTSLASGLASLLQSINITVEKLLILVKQRNRLQLVFLLVIRRAEVNDSFEVLERKKNTLILYLTAQNSAAIASLKIPQSTRALKMAQKFVASSVDSGYLSSSSSAVSLSSTASSSSAVSSTHQPDQLTVRNGELPPVAQQTSIGSNINQPPPRLPKKELNGTAGGTFYTNRNKALDQSLQFIGGLKHQGMNARHEKNISKNHARQCIGADQCPDAFWESGQGAQDPEDNATIKKDCSSTKKDHAGSKKDHAGSKKDHAGSKKDHASSKKDHASSRKDHASSKKDHASSKKDNASSKKDKSASEGSWYRKLHRTP